MKALIKENKKIGMSLKDIEKPNVKPGHLLVKVKAASICGGDNYLYRWDKIMEDWNLHLPLLIGHEICGDIVDIGPDLKNNFFDFKVGAKIAADSHLHCNKCPQCLNNKKHNCDEVKVLGIHADGGFAEYINLPSEIAFKVPDEISYEEGALLEPFGVGVKAFYMALPSLADKVAIIGGGPIGVFIAKLCAISGNKNTYVFEPSEYRSDLVRKTGVKECINPLDLEKMKAVKEKFDICFEVSGTASGLNMALKYARKNGQVIIIGAQQDKILIDIKNDIMLKELTLKGTFGRLMWDTWFKMIDIIKNKQIDLKEFITHRFTFDQYEEAFSVSLSRKCNKIILFP